MAIRAAAPSLGIAALELLTVSSLSYVRGRREQSRSVRGCPLPRRARVLHGRGCQPCDVGASAVAQRQTDHGPGAVLFPHAWQFGVVRPDRSYSQSRSACLHSPMKSQAVQWSSTVIILGPKSVRQVALRDPAITITSCTQFGCKPLCSAFTYGSNVFPRRRTYQILRVASTIDSWRSSGPFGRHPPSQTSILTVMSERAPGSLWHSLPGSCVGRSTNCALVALRFMHLLCASRSASTV